MEEAKARHAGADGLRPRPRLHGHERVLRRGRRGGVDRHHPPRASSSGVTFLDTADMYGPFKNEELVGRAIRGRRDQVVLATKFGNVREPRRRAGGRQRHGPSTCARPATPRSRRLGVDHIDLYYQHRVDPKVPIEETVGAMAELVRAGQGPLPGALRGRRRRPSAARTRVHPISALQTEYSLWTPRSGGRDPAHGARAGHRLRGLQPARARLPDRPLPQPGGPARRTTTAAARRASRARTSRRTCDLVDRVEALAREKGRARRRSWRWRGCWPRARTSCPSPAPHPQAPGGERRRGGDRPHPRGSGPHRGGRPAGRLRR